ncbi:MAG: hypothetical protein E2O94_06170 [Alphaproteobacteria bacterium]|nr:MAG: hypothetical protein E2O94_06170 [Alphaproteobacteria bacterium]
MEINITRDRQVVVSVTTTIREFTEALRAGRLVVDLKGAPALAEGLAPPSGGEAEAGLGAGEVAAICRRYGPERLAANLLWEIAQAGDEGITSSELKEILGLSSSQKLAGVFGGIGKTADRLIPGRKGLFLDREWLGQRSEYLYRMPAGVRAEILEFYG